MNNSNQSLINNVLHIRLGFDLGFAVFSTAVLLAVSGVLVLLQSTALVAITEASLAEEGITTTAHDNLNSLTTLFSKKSFIPSSVAQHDLMSPFKSSTTFFSSSEYCDFMFTHSD